MYNNIQSPCQLPPGSNYHLFKHGIKPMWEHEANRRGGKWIIQFPHKLKGVCSCTVAFERAAASRVAVVHLRIGTRGYTLSEGLRCGDLWFVLTMQPADAGPRRVTAGGTQGFHIFRLATSLNLQVGLISVGCSCRWL